MLKIKRVFGSIILLSMVLASGAVDVLAADLYDGDLYYGGGSTYDSYDGDLYYGGGSSYDTYSGDLFYGGGSSVDTYNGDLYYGGGSTYDSYDGDLYYGGGSSYDTYSGDLFYGGGSSVDTYNGDLYYGGGSTYDSYDGDLYYGGGSSYDTYSGDLFYGGGSSVDTYNGDLYYGGGSGQQSLQRVLGEQIIRQTGYTTSAYSRPISYSQPRQGYSYPQVISQPYSYSRPYIPSYTPVPAPVPQICSISVIPTNTTITRGQAVTLRFSPSSNTSYITLTGGNYNNTRVSSLSMTVYPTTNTTYTVRCYTNYGQSNYATAYINVTQPYIPYVPPVQPINYCTNGYTNYPTCGYNYNNSFNYNYNYDYDYGYNYNNYVSNVTSNYPGLTDYYSYNNYNNYNNYCDFSVSTTGAVPSAKSATIYGYLSSCGNTTVWFDYGTNYNLSWQTTRETTSYNGQFSASLTGLTCGTTYYYRAVAQNGYNTKYGQILSFKTDSCYTPISYNYDYTYTPTYSTPKTTYKAPAKKTTYTKGSVPVPEIDVISSSKSEKGSCLCESDYMRVNIDALETAVVPGKVANFKVTYKNVGTETLKNVIVRVSLPDEMTVYSADRGQYTVGGKTVLVTFPSLTKGDEGSFIVSANVASGLDTGKQILVNAYADYTVPTVVKGDKALNSEVSAYVLTITSDSSQNMSGNVSNKIGNTTTSSSWLPTNALEWIVSIIALVAFILVLRFIIVSFKTNA